MTVRESEFSDHDRARLLADFEDEHEARSTTGVPASEAFDPALNGSWQVEVIEDFAAAALAREQEAYRKKYGKDFDLSAYRWRVHR